VPTSDELFTAIDAGDAAEVARLLKADPALVAAERGGVSAIRAAVYARHADIVDLLGQAGARLDVFDAAALGDVDCLRELIDEDPERARAFSGDGFTPLHLAAFFRHSKSTELLLGRGADPHVEATNGTGLHPLNSAVAGGNPTIVHLLLDRGADIDAPQQGGYTPLHGAAAAGDADLVALLLGRGADPALTTDDGRTAADLTQDPAVLALLPAPANGG
jgi:ankyrin repeat protein